MAGKSTKTVSERFWPKVAVKGEDECWEWDAAFDGHGYGQLRCAGKNRLATHVSLELDGKPRPSSAHVAMHSCDNPPCVNPDHLSWATRKENHQDALAKGRLNLAGLTIGHNRNNDIGAKSIARCDRCGAEFKSTPSRLAINIRNFCSSTCSTAWQSQNFSGAKRSEFGRC